MHHQSWQVIILLGVSTSLFLSQRVLTQGPLGVVTLSVGSWSSSSELGAAEALIDRMTNDGQLVLHATHGDSQLSGRTHEGFRQFFRGVPVDGASISRQTEGGTTVSIFGTVYTDIDINPNPAVSLSEATVLIQNSFGATPIHVPQPLTIVRTLDGSYALAYRVSADNAVTYVIDAHGGHVLMEVDEKREQSAVGSGSGVLGDAKKVSATQREATFEATDQLRPATIWTFDTRGSDQGLLRLIQGEHLPSDRATDSDNAWTIPGVVDTHVHAGWVHDYFFKQHSWSGMDGESGPLYAAVVDRHVLPNNAFFVAPPYGPGGAGMVAFGETHSGTPMTTLDIVAHELMHGVTDFGVSRRNWSFDYSFFDYELGPSSVWLNGTQHQCSSTTWDGRPFVCSQGRYVLWSNHGGAIGEGLSDVFGTAVEFFFQNEGTGSLRADYLMGEDLDDPFRSLSNPKSIYANSQRTVRYPDHISNRLRYTGIWLSASRIALIPWVVFDSSFYWVDSTDNGGVHVNSTILSHVFYLAVEGGTNSTSGIYVSGVGGASRSQIERVFFRAVTELMPGGLFLDEMGDVLRQAAIDLFGFSAPPTTAVYDALRAVGLE